MRRTALLAALVTLAATHPPSAAAPRGPAPIAPPAGTAIGGLRFERGDGTSGPSRSLRDVVVGAIAARDARAFPRTLRSYLRPTLRATQKPAGTVRYGEAAGDLDGDHLGDVLEFEARVPSLRPVGATARRGTNGRALWSIRFDGDTDVVIQPVGDLSGDGAGDVLVVRFDVLDAIGAANCAVAVCGEAGSGSYAWTVALLSGRTGAVVWTRPFDGQIVFSSAFTNATDADTVFATNALVVPFTTSDHDGDGDPDLVIDAFDAMHVEGTNYAGTLVSAPATLIATRGLVVSGRTGRDVFAREQPLEPGGAFLLPSKDATGDGRGDLLWQNAVIAATPETCPAGCVGGARSRVDVEMIDGVSLEPSWAATLDDADLQDAVAIPADADPTADGRSDVLLYQARKPLDDAPSFTVGVISGANGRVLWTTPADPDGSIDAVGRPAGRRGDDFIAGSFEVLSPPETQPLRVALRLDRIDGRTGRRLLRTEHIYVDTKTRTIAVIEALVVGDGNGDGVGDVLIGALHTDSDLHDLVSSSRVESGRTGAAVWSRRANHFAIAQPGGDSTGDGTDDVVDVRLGEDDIAVALIDLDPVRSVSTRLDPAPDGFMLVTSPDQTGRGGDDQVYSRLRVVPGGLFSRVDAMDARNARLTWGSGHTLPARPRGKIAGTVRDAAGRRIGDICAVAYTLDGSLAGLAATGSAGTYQIGRLANGRYKVRFADCGVQLYRVRWYKHRTDMQSAEVVTVRNGGRTSGIDEVLVKQ